MTWLKQAMPLSPEILGVELNDREVGLAAKTGTASSR